MSTPQQRASKKQENRIAKSLNQIGLEARRQMASGAMWFAKSDVISKVFQVEAKTRVKPSSSISVKKEWLDKIYGEAVMVNKIPALVFSFGDGEDFMVLRMDDALRITEGMMKNEED